MMRSHLARHVCRTRTGVIRDAIHCRSRALCLRSSSACVLPSKGSRLSHSQRPYSTDPFPKNDAEDKAPGQNDEAKNTDETRAERDSRFGVGEFATAGIEATGAREPTTNRFHTNETGDQVVEPEDKAIDVEGSTTKQPLDTEGLEPAAAEAGTEVPTSNPALKNDSEDKVLAPEDKSTETQHSPTKETLNLEDLEPATSGPEPTVGAKWPTLDPLNEAWHDPKSLEEEMLREAEAAAEYFTQDGEAVSSANSFDPEAADDKHQWEVQKVVPRRDPKLGPYRHPGKIDHQDDNNPQRVYSTRNELTWLSDAFRRVLRSQTSGVSIVTAFSDNEGPVGATVSSLTSVTLVPAPFFSFNLHKGSNTLDAIQAKRTFNVNFLDSSKDGIEVAEKFVGRSRQCSKRELWHFQKWVAGEGQPPVLVGKEIPYVFRCRLSFAKQVGDHCIVVGEVLDMTPKEDVLNPKPNSGFLTFRDGWYREPGLDPDDKRSASNYRRDAQQLEMLKLQEQRRLAHEESQKIARESQMSKEKRREHAHQRRQEAHERKMQGMKIKMMQNERWEENIRKDERERMKKEMGSQLERDLLDEAHEMLKKKGQEATPLPETPVEPVKEEQEAPREETPEEEVPKKKISPKKQRVMAEKEEKKRLEEFIPPWTN